MTNSKKMTRKYLPGTCYTCKKCLFCFNSESCKCNKSIKPKRKQNKPKRGQQIYLRIFTPNQDLPTANQFLFTANTEFQYNTNFNNIFSFTFCSACNSKYQRLKNKDKKLAKKLRNKSTLKDKKKSVEMSNKSHNFVEIEDDSSPEFSDEEYGIEEIKLQIVIEKNGKKTSKTITIQPVEYTNVIKKINVVVQKVLQNENIKSTDYSMSYKAVNARGPSCELDDKLDFNEFIEDYKKVIGEKKKMAVIIVIENSANKKKKSTEKRLKVNVYLYSNYSLFFYFSYI